MASMYVVKEQNLYVLRQTRFKAALASGSEHPHDVCAYAHSVPEMHNMVDHRWPNSIDYSHVETPATIH